MRLFPLITLSAMLSALAWSIATQPFQQDDPQAMRQCMELHPERYCRFAHAPSTFAYKQR